MLLVKAKVGKSSIHGLGLIAQEFIPKGRVIWRLQPGFDVILTLEELKNLPTHIQELVEWHGHFDQKIGKYVLSSDDDRFTNHSNAPNTRFMDDFAVVIRDIHPGEEITDNYREYGKSVDFLAGG